MPEIGKWNSHSFVVSPNVIRSFTGLTIKGSSETEEKETGAQKYVSRKSGKPAEISMTVLLSAMTGNDVRNEAMAFIDEARNGNQGYFYLGGKKLVTCQLMLTEASISETEIASSGVWVSCNVQLTFKQSGKYDSEGGGSGGGTSSASGGSKKTSINANEIFSTIKGAVTKTIGVAEDIAGAVGAAIGINNVVSNAVATIERITSNAKKQSQATKKNATPAQKVIPVASGNVMRVLD